MWDVFIKLIDANTLGGWVRSLAATILGMLAAGGWGAFLTPDTQTLLAGVASTVAVGIWSAIAKAVTPTPTLPKT